MGEPADTQRTEGETQDRLVVVGSSAGGIEAVMKLVASLPADFPAPVVIAQHINPDRPSRLAHLLASRASLRVHTVTSDEALEPGSVYVVPADRDVEITDHHVGVHDVSASLSHPSVNRLMASAASVFGENLIGVVLTGTGADGTAGAQSIKEHGGTVIVQNPESAAFSGMPGSVPPSAVDVVAELEAIGPLLVDLLSGEYALSSSGQDDGLHSFLERVREQCGLDFGAYKQPTIERRLHRRMVAVGTTTLAEYRRYVERHPEEMQRLVSSFLIKVTRFFRDPELYAHLRDHVLPGLIDEARERGELRLWSAGCATGEEAYTLAMLVTDLLGDDDSDLSVRIFATDVAHEAVEFGRHGVYPEAAMADMPQDMVERHFLRQDGAFEVRKNVRGLVVFGDHDLSRRAAFPRIDLVLCRNVLIYFTPELQRRSLQLFAFSLRQGACLVLGKAEAVSQLPEFFTLEHSRLKVFRRAGAPAPVPADRIVDAPSMRSDGSRPERPSGPHASEAHPAPPRTPSSALQAAPALGVLSTGVAIVSRNYDIQLVNSTARRLLGIRGTGTGEDLVHRVVPDLARPIRTAIDAAFQGERPTGVYRVSGDVVDEDGRDLSITCTPMRAEGDDGPVETVVLEVTDVTTSAQHQRDLAREREESNQVRHRTEAAVREVRELRSSDQEMAADLGRLQAENEQLLLATEEAQAAAEEIETLSEEQQATNEELETLNEELQATLEELNTTNADLQARANEQEALAASLSTQRRETEDERARLAAILANIGDAVLVVDGDGNVIQTNAAWERLLGPLDEFAPEDEQGQPLPREDWPHQRAIMGEAFTMQFTLPDREGGRNWFEALSQPVQRNGNDLPTWGVAVVRENSERKLRLMQERFLAVASHELRTPMTSLSGSLQLIDRRVSDDGRGERLATYVNRARDQMHRLELLIGDLTDVVRLQGGMFRVERAPVDLAAVVTEAVETASAVIEEYEVRVATPSEPVQINGDAYRLEQVVLNLIVNSFRHGESADGMDVRLRQDGAVAVIEIRDYGQGIPEEALPEIFSQFYQSKSVGQRGKGLGLGLFIVREIVTAHDGTITARSTAGEGATFEIRLPLPGEDAVVDDEEAAVSDHAASPGAK